MLAYWHEQKSAFTKQLEPKWLRKGQKLQTNQKQLIKKILQCLIRRANGPGRVRPLASLFFSLNLRFSLILGRPQGALGFRIPVSQATCRPAGAKNPPPNAPRSDFSRFLNGQGAIKKTSDFQRFLESVPELQKSTFGRPRLHF